MKRISREESPSNTSMCWFLDEDRWNGLILSYLLFCLGVSDITTENDFNRQPFFIFRGVQKKISVSKNKRRLGRQSIQPRL